MNILNYDSFFKLNENEEDHSSYYEEKEYILHESVKNEKDLFKLIENNIQKAWEEFENKFDILEQADMELGIEERKNRYWLVVKKSWKFTDLELGPFFRSMKYAQIGFFSGREILFSDVSRTAGKFYFMPYIWTTLNIGYEHFGGGSNGTSVMLDGESDGLYYDILEKKWYTRKEYLKKLYPDR